MHNVLKSLATPALVAAALNSSFTLAQDAPVTEEQADRVQQLTTEIEKLTAELNTLNPPVETVEEPKLWSGDVEFGYVASRGNTVESTMKSKADITRERDAWRFSIFFDALNSESSGARSAEKYFYANRLAYSLSEHNYLFGYISYDDDRFSGFDYQATASAGYGRRILHDEVMTWDVEIGPGFRSTKVEDGSTEDDSDEAILRLFTNYSWNFSDSAKFTQTINVEGGEDNTITKSITALKAQIIGSFSVKLSYTIKYTENVPADRKHADEETAVTLAYSF